MSSPDSILHKPHFWAVLALILATGLKLWLVAGGWAPFNADEAVVALMARHILAGARPAFFYGQAYMGSLDAWLAAAGFAIFGQQVWVIRLVQSLLYLLVLASTYRLGQRAFGSAAHGALAMLLLAIPTVNVSLYTTASLGGYGEALLLGNLSLLTAMRLADDLRRDGKARLWRGALFGLLSGLGLWAFGLALVFTLPAVIYLAVVWLQTARAETGRLDPGIWARRAAVPVLALAAGGLAGSAPWWGYALSHGFSGLLRELGGGAIAGVEQLPWIFQVGRHVFGLLLLGLTALFGIRPPWDVTWLALPLIPFVLMVWLAVGGATFRRLRQSGPRRGEQALLAGVIVTLLLAFVLTPFGADPSGRYFVPLAVPLALFAAAYILDLRLRWGQWAYGLAVLLLIFQGIGNVQSALRFPPGITTQFYAPAQVDHRSMPALIEFLRAHGETRGYTNYWVAYPLAFLSGEELIFVPRLPYHPDFRYTARDDRYAPYDEQVAQSGRTAFITTNHPDLDARLRERLSELGVGWQEQRIGAYQVFYALTRPVRPQEMGMGETTTP